MAKKIEERHGFDECLTAREICNDASLIRQYLKEEDARELGLFSFSRDRDEYKVNDISDSDGWKNVKQQLINNVGGNSIPVIYVDDLTENDVLILRHDHDGRDLDLSYADEVVEHIHSLWECEVKLFTIVEGEPWEI